MDPRLSQLDFAALRTLHAVDDTGSFTAAADRLGQTQTQTQSNVSDTIARLRKLFGDPLFVRQGGQTQPTGYCIALVAAASVLLDQFETALAPQPFDPAEAQGHVTLSCNHYERVTILPALLRHLRHLRRRAPGVRLIAIAARTMAGAQLKRGDCDLVLGPLAIESEAIYRRTQHRDRYALVVDPGHRLATGPLSPGDLDGLAHVGIQSSGRWEPLYAQSFRAAGVTLDTRFEIAEHGHIGGYVLGTDLAAIVPHRIALGLDPRLVVRQLPIEMGFAIDMVWSARTHRAPLHPWLRAAIVGLEKAAKDGPAPG